MTLSNAISQAKERSDGLFARDTLIDVSEVVDEIFSAQDVLTPTERSEGSRGSAEVVIPKQKTASFSRKNEFI